MTSRPLSAWIAHVDPVSGRRGPVNNGYDRDDAREMSYLQDGWSRSAVAVAPDRLVLGLTDPTGDTVVELDDVGSPIRISEAGLGAVHIIEERWPNLADVPAEVHRNLLREPLTLRFWLVERMARECTPPTWAYEILPWSLLDRAVESIHAGLRPGGQLGELVEIRHWLTPAVRGLAGPVEQLDHGLRTNDPGIARLGASALLRNLIHSIPLTRIPELSRLALERLVTQLGEVEPMYRHMARVAAARLTDDRHVETVSGRFNPNMEAAANSDDHSRLETEVIGDDHQWLRVTRSESGEAGVTAHIKHPGSGGLLGTAAAWFLSVRLTSPDGAVTVHWIGLYQWDDELVGSTTVMFRLGDSWLEADDGPVTVAELTGADPAELVTSIRANAASSQDIWLDVSETLAAHHPVRIAVDRYWETQ